MGTADFLNVVKQFQGEIFKSLQSDNLLWKNLRSIFQFESRINHTKTLHFDHLGSQIAFVNERLIKLENELSSQSSVLIQTTKTRLQSKIDLFQQKSIEINKLCDEIKRGSSIEVAINFDVEFQQYKNKQFVMNDVTNVQKELPVWQRAHDDFNINFDSILSIVKFANTVEPSILIQQEQWEKSSSSKKSTEVTLLVEIDIAHFKIFENILQMFIGKQGAIITLLQFLMQNVVTPFTEKRNEWGRFLFGIQNVGFFGSFSSYFASGPVIAAPIKSRDEVPAASIESERKKISLAPIKDENVGLTSKDNEVTDRICYKLEVNLLTFHIAHFFFAWFGTADLHHCG